MKKKPMLILLPALILIIFIAAYFVLHEKTQNKNISVLISQVETLTAEVKELSSRSNREKKEPKVWGDGYNWMAIGNSLTWIESCGRGICSTKPDNDYFGLVKAWLENKYDSVQAERCNYSNWEQSTLRSSMYDLIEPYLSEKLDLVTIQLGENVPYADTYGEDLIQLIRYVREKCPDAEVILIDDFWNQEMSDIRRMAAMETKTAFADLTEIRNKKEYQSMEGIEYVLPDGSTGKVTKEEETHPGDAGMAYIAEQLIKILR